MMKTEITSKLIRGGKYMIQIEKNKTFYDADMYFPEYNEIRLRLKCPHKNYEVSLMKNDWMPQDVNKETNYREIATITDVDTDNEYIDTGVRFGINDADSRFVLMLAIAAYSQSEDARSFHDLTYDEDFQQAIIDEIDRQVKAKAA